MTLEEAIIHAEEVAERCAVTDGNIKCESEHRQLAEWLKELKQLKEQTRWIPVSEKLPKDHENVLIYLSSNQITIGSYNSHRLPFMDKPIGWGADAPHDWSSDDVVAWMPLPQPYKGESEE